MPITVNKPVHTALHRREADGSATPLHPGTCAEMVAYVNAAQEAAFGGSNASEALDELFRRMAAVEAGGSGGGSETPVSPPNPQPDPDAEYIIATPRIVNPAASDVIEDDTVSLASSRFAMTRGKDTHAASEWRVAGADGRTLWNSGETTQRLTSWPSLPLDAATLSGLTTTAGAETDVVLDAAPLPGVTPLPAIGGMPAMPPLVAVCCGDTTLLGAPSSSSQKWRLWSTGGVTNGFVRLDGLFRVDGTTGTVTRAAYAGTEEAAVLWTGQRLLAFTLKTDIKTVRVLESTDLGDSWKAVTQVAGTTAMNYGVGFVANALDGVVVLALASGNGVFASTDEGRTWTRADLSDALPDARYQVAGFPGLSGSSVSLTAQGWLFVNVNASTSTSGGMARWIATRDGKTWKGFANRAETLVFEDAAGVVFLHAAASGANVTLTPTRLGGDNLETVETLPARTVNMGVSNTLVTGAAWDSETGLYIIAVTMTGNAANSDLTLMGTDLGDLAGFTQGVVNETLPGVNGLYLNGTIRLGGRDFWVARVATGTQLAEWPMTGKNGYRLLRPRLAGVLATETLNAAVRHKAATSGQWSAWSDYVPFSGRVREEGGGPDSVHGFLPAAESATFAPEVSSSGPVLAGSTTLFTVPDGVTELVILCVGGSNVSGKGGWAASCRVTVTAKQSLSIAVHLSNTSTGNVLTTSVSDMDGTALLSCTVNGVTCAGGELMRVNCGADGNAGVNYLSDADWLAFALKGGAPQTLGSGFPAFGAAYSTATGAPNGGKPAPGLVKIWWGEQIAKA